MVSSRYVENEVPIGVYIYLDPLEVYTREDGRQIGYYPIWWILQKDNHYIAQIGLTEDIPIVAPKENIQKFTMYHKQNTQQRH